MIESEVVRKTAFAELRGVSPGRVSQWIAEGKIRGDALVGEGRNALINVAVATRQLRESLDPSQRFGLNGITTDLGPEIAPIVVPGAPLIETATPQRLDAPLVDTVESQIKAEKLRQAQLATRRMEEEDRERRGLYVKAAAAKAEIMRAAADMFKTFDGALVDFAGVISGKWGIPSRDVLHALRGEFRRVRERAARDFAALAAAEPETIDDDEPSAPSQTPDT